MNVVLDGLQIQKNTESVITTNTSSYTDTAGAEGAKSRGYALDISGTVMDHAAYVDRAKTAQDLVADAKATQAAIQSQYMTVMSNSVSGTDIEKLSEEGYHPCDMELSDEVNTVDRIKATLAEAGVIVQGYNDDMDIEQLEEITGSKNMAIQIKKSFAENDIPVTEENTKDVIHALETAKQVKEPGEGTVKYMVENHMEPTLEQLYMASYSGSSDTIKQSFGYYDQNGLGYYAKKAEEFDWDSLKEQMESIIEQAGLKISETNMANARFLVESGIPLTTETMERITRFTELSFPIDETKLMQAAAIAIADGKEAMQAKLNESENLVKQAVRIKQETDSISDEAIEKVIQADKPLTIRNMTEAQNTIEEEEQAKAPVKTPAQSASDPYLSAKRQLEEVRLIMTVHANLGLLKKGYQIDTTELSQLVEDLKREEEAQNQLRFCTEDVQTANIRAGWYEDTRKIVREAVTYPISVVAGIHLSANVQINEQENIQGNIQGTTLSEVSENAYRQKKQYETAGEQYETFMTTPRKDLGDSIKKAFRNVDDILKDLELETNETNRRAVRILGYNQMEITSQNITQIKDADLLLQRVVDKLTPAATLQMIREGENPLDMTLEELEAYLTELDLQEENVQEKYSKYLYRLEQSGNISEEEKESYIGIYRLFRQIEKSDGSVIGSLINSRAELSVSNLLSALRTKKKAGMDIQISDETGAAVKVNRKTATIDEQIASAYRSYENRLASDVYDRLEPVSLKEAVKQGDINTMSLEQLREKLMEASQQESVQEETDRLEQEYRKEQLQEIRALAEVDDDAIEELLDGRQPVTTRNLLAVQTLLHSRNTVFDKLKTRMKDSYRKLPEAFGDKESAQKAYEEMIREAQGQLTEENEEYHTVRNIHEMVRQLHLSENLAKEEHYIVPVSTQDGLSAIHLTLRHEKETNGQVSVSMHTEKGRIEAELAVSDGQVYGNIECSEEAEREWMKEVKEKVQEYVDEHMDVSGEKSTTSSLYGLAKAFIFAIQTQEREG